MEKKSLIEKIKTAVNIAMDKGMTIDLFESIDVIISIHTPERKYLQIIFNTDFIQLNTSKGRKKIEYNLTDREKLEVQAIILSIKEYREKMAIYEFENFISEESSKLETIDDLDD